MTARSEAPAPADFAEHAMVEGLNLLRKRYGVQVVVLKRWINETGIERPVMPGGRVARPVPEGFAEASAAMTNHQLMALYGCGSQMLYRWRLETGAKPRAKMQIPDDFVAQWQTQGILTLAKHYKRSHSTISGWVKALGLTRARGRTMAQRKAVEIKAKAEPIPFKRSAPPPLFIKPDNYRTPPFDHVQRDMSPAGQAADFLRHFGPVYRCDVRGRPLADGFFWRRGNAVLTDDELIERAGWMQERAA